VVYDTSGGTLKGLVVEEHRDRVVLSTEQGEKTVLRTEIEEVFYSEPERNYLYLGNQALEQGDLGIARGFFGKALQINPDLSEAADALERLGDLEKKLNFKPAAEPPAALEKQWGLVLADGKGLVTVREVRSESLARKAGLAAGDELAAVWSSSLAFLSAKEIAAELIGPPGSKLKLTLRRSVKLPAGSAAKLKLSMERLGLTLAGAAPPLLPGDRVVSIDGASTRYISLGKARKMMEEAKTEGVTLGIHRDLLITRE